jgi:hypothetical protein
MVIFKIIKLVHYCPIRFHFEILFSPERRLGGGAPPIATEHRGDGLLLIAFRRLFWPTSLPYPPVFH